MWMRSKRLECSYICILPPDTQVFCVRVTVNSSLIRHLVLSILPSKSFFNSPPLLQSHCTKVTSLSPLTETMEIASLLPQVLFLQLILHMGPKHGCKILLLPEGLMLKLKLQYFGYLKQRTDSLEKTAMLGKTEGRRGQTEDEMVGWHHQLDGHESEQASGVGDGQGSLVCCSPWGHKESED